MTKYYLGIDIGASSGRHILAHMENKKMCMEEIYRFSNGMETKDGKACWNIIQLFNEIITGMKKCKVMGKIPVSVGIDTWAVDFVLLDNNNNIIGNAVAYRDLRTNQMDTEVNKYITEEELYNRTGIQKQIFNTIYQLMALKVNNIEQLEKADSLLMIPDYFNFLLSGVKSCEYTNATTTQLVNPETKQWDYNLITTLGYPQHIFQQIRTAGTQLGDLLPDIQKEVGFNCKVILPATHDTGSAVLAVPSNERNAVYISSGTWSLMGIEIMEAECSDKSRKLNFTNEGGYNYRFRYLKNIMGLWMIQSVKKEIANDYSFSQICQLAKKEMIDSLVDCNDNRFLAPSDMTDEVKKACEETSQQVPTGIAQVAAVIYNSLAVCYANTIKEIEEITHTKMTKIMIVGGGANAEYLNELTAKYTGKKVLAGPVEATAIGNIMVQMIADKTLENLKESRECVSNSFEIKEY